MVAPTKDFTIWGPYLPSLARRSQFKINWIEDFLISGDQEATIEAF